jgi:hypothetical protein
MQPAHNQPIIFWQQIGLYIPKPHGMKTLINQITILLTPAFSKEKMPALIPIRVVTRVSNHHR